MLAKGRTLWDSPQGPRNLTRASERIAVLLITEQSLQPLGLTFCRSLFPVYVYVEEQKNLAAGFGGGGGVVFSNSP